MPSFENVPMVNVKDQRRTSWISNNIKIPPDRPTDAYGELEFDSTRNRVKYIRVAEDTEMDKLEHLLTNVWKLKIPNFILSVTGGTKHFKMHQNLTCEFQKTLIETAESTGAWIMTAGTHVGVMKMVGSAIHKHTTGKFSEIVAFGISTWGIVHNSHKLQEKHEVVSYECEEPNSLDKNHSHFILVDDGLQGRFSSEIGFRTNLEHFIASRHRIQVVYVMVEGGPSALKTVRNALLNGSRVVVVGGSGQWANILATICSENFSNPVTETDISKLLSEQGMPFGVSAKDISLWTSWAKECASHKNLVNIFSLENIEDFRDLEVAIMKAILAGSAQNEENAVERHLQLAMDLNRPDIASSDILTDHIDISQKTLLKYFERALVEDKCRFVKLFLDHGLELQSRFNREKILELYNKKLKDLPFRQILNWDITKELEDGDIFRLLKELLGPLYNCKAFDTDTPLTSQGALRHLFIWCILQNKKECSKHLWEAMREEELPASIIANRLLTSLSKKARIKEKKEELVEHAKVYQKHSYGILAKCCSNNPEKSTKLLKRRLNNWGNLTCLQVAVDSGDANFVSQLAVQIFLDNVWFGKISKDEQRNSILLSIVIFICAFFPVLIPYLISFSQEEPDKNNKERGDMEIGSILSEENCLLPNSCANSSNEVCRKDSFKKICSFYQAPIVKFHLTILSHLVFLTLFAYILLFNLFPTISIFEYILLAWVTVLVADEIRQIFEITPEHWMSRFGNKLDVISFILYYFGFVVRFANVDAARVLLSLAFIVFCLRILNVFSIHKQLGPKLLMVGKMLEDLFFFIFILLVFLIAYGVASQALLYPNETDVGRVFEGILSKPYWNIYGELFLPEILFNPTDDEFTCTNDTALIAQGQRPCPSQNVIVPIMSAVYLLLANVLLLNLLIAMFSYTFDGLVSKTDTIWKYQRHALVQEYYNRSCFVVPLSVFFYVPKLIQRIRNTEKEKKNTAFDHKFTGDRLKHLVAWESLNADAYLTQFRSNERETINLKMQNVSDRIDALSATVDAVRLNMKQLKKDIKALKPKPNTMDEPLGWIISALRDHDLLPKNLVKPVHLKARTTPYPESSVARYTFKDQMVSWNIPFPEYNPPHHTADKVFHSTSLFWDAIDERDEAVLISLPFNKFDPNKRVDRKSYTGRYDVVNGLPRNPGGRTGLTGRGLLGRYGPNHAADPIVTRWKRNQTGEIEERDGKPVLEFIAIQREDTKEWAIPGGMLNPGEDVNTVFNYKCFDKIADAFSTENEDSTEQIEEFFDTSGVEIFRGYCDDHRNTDCAWIETVAYNFHDEDGTVFQHCNFSSGEEQSVGEQVGPKWVTFKDSLNLFADHKKYIGKVASLHKAYFKPQVS